MNEPNDPSVPTERERLVRAGGSAAAGAAKVVGVSILATLTVIATVILFGLYLLSRIF